jgi:hypothetical protein
VRVRVGMHLRSGTLRPLHQRRAARRSLAGERDCGSSHVYRARREGSTRRHGESSDSTIGAGVGQDLARMDKSHAGASSIFLARIRSIAKAAVFTASSPGIGGGPDGLRKARKGVIPKLTASSGSRSANWMLPTRAARSSNARVCYRRGVAGKEASLRSARIILHGVSRPATFSIPSMVATGQTGRAHRPRATATAHAVVAPLPSTLASSERLRRFASRTGE